MKVFIVYQNQFNLVVIKVTSSYKAAEEYITRIYQTGKEYHDLINCTYQDDEYTIKEYELYDLND